MATAPKIVVPMASTAMLMATTNPGENAIEAATTRHERIFVAYMVVLVVTALLVALFTWLTWDSGNKVQDAVHDDANARISQANQRSAEANALAASAHADAEAARVEQERLKNDSLKLELRLQGAEQEQAQLRQKNTEATAQIQKLQEAGKPRTISPSQQDKIIGLLKTFAGQEVQISRFAQENEAALFAAQISQTLEKAGLKTSNLIMMDGTGTGLGVAVHDEQSAPLLATTLLLAFRSAGIDIVGITKPEMIGEGKFFLFVGAKPSAR